MQGPTSHSSWHRLATAIVAACLLTAASAAAEVDTAATPLDVQGYPAGVAIGFYGTNQADVATLAGGVTLFTAYVPNGPLLARLPFLPPFLIEPDSSTPVPWRFSGVPPGTYYVALVYGIADVPNIPAAAWTRLVVPGACTGAPGVGLVDRRLAEVEPNTVRLFLSTFGGCATSFLVEAGASPGAANVASLETSQVLLSDQVTLTWTPPAQPFLFPATATSFTASVPSGTYAVQLYAGNACGSFGPGIASVIFTVP